MKAPSSSYQFFDLLRPRKCLGLGIPSWGLYSYRLKAGELRSNIALRVIAFLLVVMLFYGSEAQAPVTEQEAKVSFLTKFPEFVRWPAAPTAPITIGVLGDDPFGNLLDKMNVSIKRSKHVEDLKGCQVVFVARSEMGNIAGIIETLEGTNVLTVGDSEGFAKQGGVIGFVLLGDRVRFEVNTAAARRAGLGIDLRLLKLAVRVFNS